MSRGMELKIRRIEKKVKAIELAQNIGLTQSALSLIENDYTKCNDTLYKILIDGINNLSASEK